MRAVLVGLLSLNMIGCDAILGEEPGIGASLPDGSIVVGQGQVDGAEWTYRASRDRGQLCMSLTLSGVQREPSCQQVAGLGTSASTAASHDNGLTMVEGLVGGGVARVRFATAQGPLEAPVVSLAALGVRGGAFGLVVAEPEMADFADNIYLDPAGIVLDRSRLAPIDMEPIE